MGGLINNIQLRDLGGSLHSCLGPIFNFQIQYAVQLPHPITSAYLSPILTSSNKSTEYHATVACNLVVGYHPSSEGINSQIAWKIMYSG